MANTKLHDAVDPFVVWWEQVQKQPRTAQKARQKLGDSWTLQCDQLQEGACEAVVGLAGVAAPDSARLVIPGRTPPWRLPGLLPVVDALRKAGAECVCETWREWTLTEDDLEAVEYLTQTFLELCRPTTVTLTLQHHHHTAALPAFMASLAQTSCSLNLLLETDFEGRGDVPPSDPLLVPLLKRRTRARLCALSCHLGEDAAQRFTQQRKQRTGSNEDVTGLLSVRPVTVLMPVLHCLQVLKVRVSNVEALEALSQCLPIMTLLQELDINLALSRLQPSEDIPALGYCRNYGLTLRLPGISDARAEWAGKVASFLSHCYDYIWLTWCPMTADGGTAFLRQLSADQVLVKGVYVFSLSGRPSARQLLSLSVQAAQLPAHTTLHW